MLVFSRFLRYFVKVTRHGSIRRASEHLNVSASAIDRQILAAEAEFGIPLFERLPSGLRPTAAGELLLNSAGRWTRDFERVQGQMADLLGLRLGHVRVAIIEALAKGFVPRLVRSMRDAFPGITFEIRVVGNKDVHASIVAGDVDIGLMLNPQSSKDIAVRGHCDVVLGFVTPPDHPLAHVESCRFSRCIGEPIIAPMSPLVVYEQFRALQASTGIAVLPVASSNNVQMLKSLVSDGIGMGLLSSLDVMEDVRRGELAFTRIVDDTLKPLTLALCVGGARQLSAAANVFLKRVELELETL